MQFEEIIERAERTCGSLEAAMNSDQILAWCSNGETDPFDTDDFHKVAMPLHGKAASIAAMEHIWASAVQLADNAIMRGLQGDPTLVPEAPLRNRATALSLYEEGLGKPMDGQAMQEHLVKLVNGGAKLNVAAVAYVNLKSQGNFTSLHHAVAEFTNAKKLVSAAPATSVLSLCTTILEEAYRAHAGDDYDAACLERIGVARAALDAKVADAQTISGGRREAGNWKTFSKSSSLKHLLKEVEEPQMGLLKGPGGQVQKIKVDLGAALQAFKAEIARFPVQDPLCEESMKLAQDVIDESSATMLECHIARNLLKDNPQAKAEGISKYLTMYAHVPNSAVHPLLWDAAQKVLSKKR